MRIVLLGLLFVLFVFPAAAHGNGLNLLQQNLPQLLSQCVQFGQIGLH